MEDMLAVYTRPRDPDCPLVCLDETSKQLIAETRVPIQMKPGRPARLDYEYERNETANLFMMFALSSGSTAEARSSRLSYSHCRSLAGGRQIVAHGLKMARGNPCSRRDTSGTLVAAAFRKSLKLLARPTGIEPVFPP